MAELFRGDVLPYQWDFHSPGEKIRFSFIKFPSSLLSPKTYALLAVLVFLFNTIRGDIRVNISMKSLSKSASTTGWGSSYVGHTFPSEGSCREV